ncbi:MAG: ACP S-malonyltransferase [Spirochaetales bacterium]|nr:ACP S-malonyltransferase [Spirochaetales bacterium]
MKKNVCFFPGQGAQYPGMGRDLYEASAEVRELFDAASDTTGRDIKHLIFNGSEEDLKITSNTQVAITLVNISVYTILKTKGLLISDDSEPVYAGFSLGELSAYYAAGIIDLKTLFSITNMRGNLMAKAAKEAVAAHGTLGMAAVIGKGFEEVKSIISDSGLEHVYPSNDNGPKQVVIAGVEESIKRLTEVLKEAGVRRVIPLRVGAPFHTPFLVSAAEEFKGLISDFSFSDPEYTVFTNVDGGIVKTGQEAKANCSKQQISTVRWTTTIQAIAGYEETGELNSCFESGPGKVLSGLWRGSGSSISCRTAGTMEMINEL